MWVVFVVGCVSSVCRLLCECDVCRWLCEWCLYVVV